MTAEFIRCDETRHAVVAQLPAAGKEQHRRRAEQTVVFEQCAICKRAGGDVGAQQFEPRQARRDLGVSVQLGAPARFDDNAPLAAVRRAIA